MSFSQVAGNWLKLSDGGTFILPAMKIDAGLWLSDTATILDFGAVTRTNPLASLQVRGGSGNDTLRGRAAIDDIYGGAGNDQIYGRGGNDYFEGGAGTDRINGGDGDDRFIIRDGDLGAGVENYDGGAGTDTLEINFFNSKALSGLNVTGFERIVSENFALVDVPRQLFASFKDYTGRFTITGTGSVTVAGAVFHAGCDLALADGITDIDLSGSTSENMSISGNNGANVIKGPASSSQLYGGSGDDTLVAGAGGSALYGGFGDDIMQGGDGVDLLDGSTGRNQAYAGGGDDIIRVSGTIGSEGSVVDGGAGFDVLEVGEGPDISTWTISNVERLVGGAIDYAYGPIPTLLGAAQLQAFQAIDRGVGLVDGGSVSFAGKTLTDFWIQLSDAGNSLDFTGSLGTDSISLFGGAGDDLAIGIGGTLQGGGGNDTLSGAVTADTLVGGAGRDALHGLGGNDTLRISQASEVQPGETYHGGSGTDTLLYTGAGDATLDLSTSEFRAFEKIDTAQGGTLKLKIAQLDPLADLGHWDTIRIANAGTIAMAGVAAVDVDFALSNLGNTLDLRGFLQSVTNVTGGKAADVVWGSKGANILAGGGGNDELHGEGGADRIGGGTGNDSLFGGDGTDVFVLDGRDLGTDVIHDFGTGERIDVSALGIGDFASLQPFIRQVGADTVIELGWNGQVEKIVLEGIAVAAVTASQFIFNNNLAGMTFNGSAGADVIVGSRGDDRILGGLGNDILVGGAGLDRFVFGTTPNATTNRDTIRDFNPAQDTIELSHAVFTATTTGNLAVSAFQLGAAANDMFDRIIYNSATGDILYDPDGNGLAQSILFAHVNAGTALTAADFVIA